MQRLIRLSQLDALVAVVEPQLQRRGQCAQALAAQHPSFGRAMERLLGVPLFEEDQLRIVPTRDAENLARRARLAVAEIEQARAE